MIGYIAYLSAALLAAAQPVRSEGVIANSQFTTSGPLLGNDLDDPALIWFQSFDGQARYSIVRPTAAELEQFNGVLDAADQAKMSLTIVYDAAAGKVDEEAGRIVYPLCSVRLDEQLFTTRHPCTNRPLNLARARTELLLAIGHAQAVNENLDSARSLLTRVLESPSITPAMRRIALHSRAYVLETAADEGVWASPAMDRLLIASLADYRALAALDAEDSGAARNVAYTLGLLGDYQASMAGYRSSLEKWPDRSGNVDVSMAAMARNFGDFEQSLALLDRALAKSPDGQGMRYNYHRGWTLTKLGRFDEAIAAFSEGMKTQPDYPWAYVKRACAHAQVGQHSRALDDLERGIALAAKLPPMTQTAASLVNQRRRIEIRDMLKQAVASGATAPLPQACGGFAGFSETTRTRSPLLEGR